jgi:CelD/BcsL family acetyltransferase involved in cellulose biosynthesis
MGYDPVWERYSVGQLLKAEILRRCFDAGTGEYDFLGVMTRAKADWMPLTRRHEWQFIFSRALRGRALHAWKFALVPRIKRILHR